MPRKLADGDCDGDVEPCFVRHVTRTFPSPTGKDAMVMSRSAFLASPCSLPTSSGRVSSATRASAASRGKYIRSVPGRSAVPT